MKKVTCSTLTICMLLVSTPSYAFLDKFFSGGANPSETAQVMKLSAIYKQLKKEYEGIMDTLEQAKAQSKELQKLSNMAKDAMAEREFIMNFSMEREIEDIKDDLDGLTMLDNLEGRTPEEKLRILSDEVDRRFEGKNATKEEKDAARKVKEKISRIEKLQKLKAKKEEEAQKLQGGNATEKDLLGSIATSSALMTALQVAEKEKEAQEEIAQEVEMSEMRKQQENFEENLRALSEGDR